MVLEVFELDNFHNFHKFQDHLAVLNGPETYSNYGK